MFEARNLSLSVGTKELLSDTSFRVGDTDHVGLVGLNGTGKSTLLRLISGTGSDSALISNGQFIKSAETTIGYLPQEISFEGDLEKTALHYALQANARLFELSGKITTMEHELALPEQDYESAAYHDLIERYSDAMHEFDHLGGYSMQSDAEKVLAGLGFSEIDFHKKVKSFSGGWQMRLHIAKLLLQNPTLLLLDEPTNHLDIDSLRWLENYLLNYEHSYMIVSHDRFFLDKLTTKTLEISFQRIEEYKGNYSRYEIDKAERFELMMCKYQNDKKKIAELQSFVNRFRAKATKARQAQSRLRQMEKLEKEMECPEEDLSRISFRFPKAQPSGREVMRLEGVGKSYPLPDGTTKQVLKGLDLEIMRGDRIAIVGSNGAGKTTFCKILADEIEFDGKLTVGHNVTLNYFAQHQTENLAPDKSIYKEMLDAAPTAEAQKKVRDILGCFLFSGDAIEKKIKVLSGGEKSRVALARILLQASNLLVMDEPTNHLDMRSKEMLIDSLENYDGTLLLVSHDRYFLDSLVNKVVALKNGSLQLYLGTYAEYLEKSEQEHEEEKRRECAALKAKSAATKAPEAKKPTGRAKAEKQKDPKKIAALEKEINRMEQDKERMETLMATEDFYRKSQNETAKVLEEYHALSEKLEKLFADWEAAGGKHPCRKASFPVQKNVQYILQQMTPDNKPIPMADMNHLTGLSRLSADSITGLLDTAAGFKQTLRSPNASFSPTLKNRRIALVFFENSTRTRFSFEIAARNLGAGTLGFSAASSSVSKGETLSDTIKNLEAMQVDAFVLRHPSSGSAKLISRITPKPVINAGDGSNEHPTRALLDMFTLREHFGSLKGLKVTIIGDVLHSRVARSNIYGLLRAGAEVGLCGPVTLIPPDAEKLGVRLFTDLDRAIARADTAIVLRLQLERASGTYLPSLEEYSRHYGLTDERLERTGKHLLVLHPGPINREIEISNHVADRIQPPGYSKSMLLEQVTNGIAIRMAVLETLLGGTP